MARLNRGTQNIRLEGIADPVNANDAATRGWVVANAGAGTADAGIPIRNVSVQQDGGGGTDLVFSFGTEMARDQAYGYFSDHVDDMTMLTDINLSFFIDGRTISIAANATVDLAVSTTQIVFELSDAAEYSLDDARQGTIYYLVDAVEVGLFTAGDGIRLDYDPDDNELNINSTVDPIYFQLGGTFESVTSTLDVDSFDTTLTFASVNNAGDWLDDLGLDPNGSFPHTLDWDLEVTLGNRTTLVPRGTLIDYDPSPATQANVIFRGFNLGINSSGVNLNTFAEVRTRTYIGRGIEIDHVGDDLRISSGTTFGDLTPNPDRTMIDDVNLTAGGRIVNADGDTIDIQFNGAPYFRSGVTYEPNDLVWWRGNQYRWDGADNLTVSGQNFNTENISFSMATNDWTVTMTSNVTLAGSGTMYEFTATVNNMLVIGQVARANVTVAGSSVAFDATNVTYNIGGTPTADVATSDATIIAFGEVRDGVTPTTTGAHWTQVSTSSSGNAAQLIAQYQAAHRTPVFTYTHDDTAQDVFEPLTLTGEVFIDDQLASHAHSTMRITLNNPNGEKVTTNSLRVYFPASSIATTADFDFFLDFNYAGSDADGFHQVNSDDAAIKMQINRIATTFGWTQVDNMNLVSDGTTLNNGVVDGNLYANQHVVHNSVDRAIEMVGQQSTTEPQINVKVYQSANAAGTTDPWVPGVSYESGRLVIDRENGNRLFRANANIPGAIGNVPATFRTSAYTGTTGSFTPRNPLTQERRWDLSTNPTLTGTAADNAANTVWEDFWSFVTTRNVRSTDHQSVIISLVDRDENNTTAGSHQFGGNGSTFGNDAASIRAGMANAFIRSLLIAMDQAFRSHEGARLVVREAFTGPDGTTVPAGTFYNQTEIQTDPDALHYIQTQILAGAQRLVLTTGLHSDEDLDRWDIRFTLRLNAEQFVLNRNTNLTPSSGSGMDANGITYRYQSLPGVNGTTGTIAFRVRDRMTGSITETIRQVFPLPDNADGAAVMNALQSATLSDDLGRYIDHLEADGNQLNAYVHSTYYSADAMGDNAILATDFDLTFANPTVSLTTTFQTTPIPPTDHANAPGSSGGSSDWEEVAPQQTAAGGTTFGTDRAAALTMAGQDAIYIKTGGTAENVTITPATFDIDIAMSERTLSAADTVVRPIIVGNLHGAGIIDFGADSGDIQLVLFPGGITNPVTANRIQSNTGPGATNIIATNFPVGTVFRFNNIPSALGIVTGYRASGSNAVVMGIEVATEARLNVLAAGAGTAIGASGVTFPTVTALAAAIVDEANIEEVSLTAAVGQTISGNRPYYLFEGTAGRRWFRVDHMTGLFTQV